jgi:AcrR family transcriptional regulator
VPDQSETLRLTRKEREHRFRVNLVLDAALEVFMQQPFAVARIEDIAERAELSVGTLYNLFESKEEIYKRVISRQQNLFFERVATALAHSSEPHDQLHIVIRVFFNHLRENLATWKFHVVAAQGLSSEIRASLFREVLDAAVGYRRRLAKICEEGIRRGVFRAGIAPELMAVIVDSVPHSFLYVIFQSDQIDPLSLLPAALEAVDRMVGADPPR